MSITENDIEYIDLQLSQIAQNTAPKITKREYFAGLAMQGHLASLEAGSICDVSIDIFKKVSAKGCVAYADALLAELSKEEGE